MFFRSLQIKSLDREGIGPVVGAFLFRYFTCFKAAEGMTLTLELLLFLPNATLVLVCRRRLLRDIVLALEECT